MKTSKRVVFLTTLTTIVMIFVCALIYISYLKEDEKTIRVGYIYQGDSSTPYNKNFINAQKAIEKEFGDQVESIVFYNVSEVNIDSIYEELIASKCDIVFANSYGYGETVKRWAKENPGIQFCQATCSNANEGEILENYHNYMGTIYQGRYVAGVVAGAKLKEMILEGIITKEQAVIGYVAAFPYAEVISGYTAFYMGVCSQIDTVVMKVIYVNSWSDYANEKLATKRLIEDGCVLISQHSDTIGPAVVCQEMCEYYPVIHVGYNGSMIDVAPTTSLISSKINWIPYELAAVEAVLMGKKIERNIDGEIEGNDAWAGFDKGWIELIGLNEFIAPEGVEELIDTTVKELERGLIDVFSGPFTGTDPFDYSDVIDLSTSPYQENKKRSAPQFHYVLDDVIEIIELTEE